MRNEAFVVVGGDSGIGKSSLCRAGVLPWLTEHDGWSCVEVIPGRHPVRSLAAALAIWTGVGEVELATLLRATPDAVAPAVRHQTVTDGPPRRLLVFVDQLEELLTLSEPEEARVVASSLAALAVHTPSVRVLACCRSDFLSRVTMLPGLASEMTRGLYFLPPLTGERIREVIVRPAAAKGVTYESEALIDTLIEQTEHAPGGLPLLQFTLAELWDARDVGARMIRAASLAALGGVEGALTRHADRLLAGLRAGERDAARRILLRLVTAEGTRARRSEAELLSHGAERNTGRAPPAIGDATTARMLAAPVSGDGPTSRMVRGEPSAPPSGDGPTSRMGKQARVTPASVDAASPRGNGAPVAPASGDPASSRMWAERVAEERVALEVLVRGRVVVANDAQDGAYEIAHEALLASWPTLQGWLRRGAVDHAAQARVEQAAATWERMGRPRDLLWGRRQLTEARALVRETMAPREAAFLAAARQAIRRRWMLGAGGAAVLVIGAVIVGLAIRANARRELEAMVADQTRVATTAQEAARQIAAQRDVARSRALGLFDAHRWSDGEDAWTQVEVLASREESEYRIASNHLETALSLNPTRARLRERFADLTFERLSRAERDRHGDLADELAGRVAAYDDGRHRAELGADARVELEIVPAGTQVWSERPGAARQLVGQAPLSPLTVPAGSVVLSFEARGHVAARLPVLLARGETLGLRVVLPTAESAPPGMVYVPPGRFLFGSADSFDALRQLFNTVPLHEVSTAGYFIGRYEVTFAEWIEFLDELPPEERRRRSPGANFAMASVTLTEIGPKRWRLSLTPTTRTYTAETGQRLHYERRAKRADQDWMKFPVSAVSYEDAVAFASWLDRTRRIPGARLCDEYEWERAARGADARTFPTGATLAPDDADIDVTYGREPLAFGPDEVGSHPSSRSPVGADDMAGSVWEWTRSVETPDAPVMRGGSWYQGELTARSMNRENGEPTLRTPLLGVRLCVTPP